MQIRKLFRYVRPFMSVFAVIATSTVLVITIYFTELGSQWVIFLAGILVAAILAEATRRSYAEWVVIRRTAQLSKLKTKFEHVSQFLKAADKALANSKPILQLVNEELPTMIAFVDKRGCCQYHNRAFLDGFQLRADQTYGRHMREVLGPEVYRETATTARQSLDGRTVHYELTGQMRNGSASRLSIKHLPQFGLDGTVTGYYMLMTDITGSGDVRKASQIEPSVEQAMFVDSYAAHVAGQHDGNLIRKSIENGEFSLYCQLITPLSTNPETAGHYEILVRLMEEEEVMIPPGMFFPLAEKYGLMPLLDRWVVQHTTEWIAGQTPPAGRQNNSIFFINVSGTTIADQGFPEFLQLTLQEYDVPGASLCFEVTDSELSSRTADVAEFARQVKQCGCHVALSGFGRDRVLFDLIRGFRVEFLKIDGRVVLDIQRDASMLAKISALSQVAQKIGVKTIAEMVEDEETVAKLKEIGIDYAQGFGISLPRPLKG